MKSRLIAFALILGFAVNAHAINLSVSGGWAPTLGAADLAGGAGTGFRSTIESPPAQVNLTISGFVESTPWTIRVQGSSAALPPGVTVAVRPTAEGNCGSLSLGQGYLEVTSFPQDLFSGVGSCSGINLQLQLLGVSIQHAPGNYGAEITYFLVQ
ncbi:conserved exported hypothetical protein [Thiocapsa sp. KS1]|nr:conserved exported hypothetical protein [Thiocapsa sp. KS1]